PTVADVLRKSFSNGPNRAAREELILANALDNQHRPVTSAARLRRTARDRRDWRSWRTTRERRRSRTAAAKRLVLDRVDLRECRRRMSRSKADVDRIGISA